MSRVVRIWSLLLAAATVAVLTISPAVVPDAPGAWNSGILTDVVFNLLLFIPLGAGLHLIGIKPFAAAGIAAAATATIEVSQYWIPGRTASIRDAIINFLGASLGILITSHWRMRARWWRIAGPALSSAILVVSVGSSFLTRPATIAPAMWYGWVQYQRGPALFTGRVLEFTVQDIPVVDGPLPASAALTEQLGSRDTIEFSATLISGPQSDGRAQLVGVATEEGDYLSLWQEGRALLIFMRLRLVNVGLPNTWLRLENAFPDAPESNLTFSAAATRRSLVLATTTNSKVSANVEFAYSPALFWAAFLPVDFEAPPRLPLWAFLPMAIAFAAMGMGLSRASVLIVAVAVSLLLGPLLAGTSFPPLGGFAAAMIGSWVGRVIAIRLGMFGPSAGSDDSNQGRPILLRRRS